MATDPPHPRDERRPGFWTKRRELSPRGRLAFYVVWTLLMLTVVVGAGLSTLNSPRTDEVLSTRLLLMQFVYAPHTSPAHPGLSGRERIVWSALESFGIDWLESSGRPPGEIFFSPARADEAPETWAPYRRLTELPPEEWDCRSLTSFETVTSAGEPVDPALRGESWQEPLIADRSYQGTLIVAYASGATRALPWDGTERGLRELGIGGLAIE